MKEELRLLSSLMDGHDEIGTGLILDSMRLQLELPQHRSIILCAIVSDNCFTFFLLVWRAGKNKTKIIKVCPSYNTEQGGSGESVNRI